MGENGKGSKQKSLGKNYPMLSTAKKRGGTKCPFEYNDKKRG